MVIADFRLLIFLVAITHFGSSFYENLEQSIRKN
jgi:hypothetical protein